MARERSWEVKSGLKDHRSHLLEKQLECHLAIKRVSGSGEMCSQTFRETVRKNAPVSR